VLDFGCKISGCTLHFISEEVDKGPIIMQKAVKINENETIDSLKKKVQKAEQSILIKAIDLYSKGKIILRKGKVFILR
jgi:phosphoribosylglycinamide formyltransferase-1